LLDLILKGIVTGFILSIMIGPVFFILLETSIRKGIRAGLAFNFGVFLSDVLYILIAYIFFAQVSELANGANKGNAKIIGGILFLVYGVLQFLKKTQNMEVQGVNSKMETSWSEYAKLSLKGFVLNFANPLVIFYWFSVLTLGDTRTSQTDPGSKYGLLIYVTIILVTFFSIDVLKIVGAKQLRPLVTNRLLKALNQLIGIVFVSFGVILLIQGIYYSKPV
jgi:threonine/homoserine/homoserine lactone efflux protein